MTGLILPPGVEYAADALAEGGGALIDNRTDLPDEVVAEAVADHWVEHGSVLGAKPSTFQTYAAEGSLLARTEFQTPGGVWDEIRLARDLAERDDDVRSTVGAMIALAFSEGMENFHPDERTTSLFNVPARQMNLDGVLKRMYREYLIAQQVTTVSLYQRRQAVPIGDEGDTEQMVAPFVGVLRSEFIRPIGSDLFGNAELAYIPEAKLEAWLREFFDQTTTPAREAQPRREDPVAAAMFTGPVGVENHDDLIGSTTRAYRLNPRMVHRVTAPNDTGTPRPLLTADFSLLEAKRLLNLMDYALLQGGMNFIVVAKKGDKDRPARQDEVENLKDGADRPEIGPSASAEGQERVTT